MIPEVGEDVKDVYEHSLRENSVGHAQTVGNKSVCYLQPRRCAIISVERISQKENKW